MAFRIIVPPLTSEFLGIIKSSAVAMTIGLLELTGAARSMQEFTFQTFEAFAAATVLYLINIAVVGLMRVVEKHSSAPGFTVLRSTPQATWGSAVFHEMDWNVIISSLPLLFLDGCDSPWL